MGAAYFFLKVISRKKNDFNEIQEFIKKISPTCVKPIMYNTLLNK